MDLKNIQNCTKYFNILYIEDDETISKNITEILESLFNKVVFVKSAEEALARYISTQHEWHRDDRKYFEKKSSSKDMCIEWF